jgi:hypothetical protein
VKETGFLVVGPTRLNVIKLEIEKFFVNVSSPMHRSDDSIFASLRINKSSSSSS